MKYKREYKRTTEFYILKVLSLTPGQQTAWQSFLKKKKKKFKGLKLSDLMLFYPETPKVDEQDFL